MGNDDSSFVLYGMGEKPEALTLGSLVLEKYWQPLIARHYTHTLLNDEDLRQHAHTTQLTSAIFHGCSRLTPGVGLDAGDIANLSLAYHRDQDRIIIAEKGVRATLKDPECFLETNVLTNPDAQKKLKMWLSAANSDYVMNFKFARRPKIWLLTGLYLLEGTRAVVAKSHSSSVSVGISSALVGLISSVPIGGSVSLGSGSSWEMAMQVAEPHVWAAQFRLLDARFIKMGRAGVDGVRLPSSLGLYRDVLSINRITRAAGGGTSVELELEKENGLGSSYNEDQESQELKEYEKRLEEAMEVFERSLTSHFLQ
ncbi:hypothetical protein N7495_006207 [Penicillium taxi]|uniref:uncharacterized protein n=1 Tax=Penicillium taxi TaxID=168475 RepID=UPI00254572C8|nr:uncharacterized protein N7495_006207 [Penicillium taxi]KAJ5894516.1 hypothetical protein N7495_006207 [Penicillium taxi]